MSGNFVHLPLEVVREYVKERLNVEPVNVGVCTIRNNTISIFNDRLLATEQNPFYALVPKDYKKDENIGKYVYDIGYFNIYKIDKEYINFLDIDVKFLPESHTYIKVSDKQIVYSTGKGVVEAVSEYDRELNARETVCVMLRVPKSGTAWIDTLIKEAINN